MFYSRQYLSIDLKKFAPSTPTPTNRGAHSF